MIKKNQHISDNIITTADSDDATALTDTPQQNSARRRHRPTKIPKTADRTLLIPQTISSKDTSVNGVKDQMQKKSDGGDGGGGEGRTQQEEGGKEGDTWTQNQQVIFEWALRHFPKGTDKRWDRIAEQIPGKTKVTENERRATVSGCSVCLCGYVCILSFVYFILFVLLMQFFFFSLPNSWEREGECCTQPPITLFTDT